jgi:hypothetical protein
MAERGQPKVFKSPEELWGKFTAYKQWCKDNPRLKEDYVGKDAVRVMRQLQRPLSWIGFECWLFDNGIACSLSHYEANTNNGYEEFLPIIRTIKHQIETDQFDGAVVGQYNQNIIARKLGLIDKREEKLSINEGAIINWNDDKTGDQAVPKAD